MNAKAPLPLVEIEAGQYLIDILHQLGPVRSNGMGLSVPDWSEIVAFATANGLPLDPWEYRLIRTMSKAYLAGFNSGREALSIPPMKRGKETEE